MTDETTTRPSLTNLRIHEIDNPVKSIGIAGDTYRYVAHFRRSGMAWSKRHKMWTTSSRQVAENVIATIEAWRATEIRREEEEKALRARIAEEQRVRDEIESIERKARIERLRQDAATRAEAERLAAEERRALIARAEALVIRPSSGDLEILRDALSRLRRNGFAHAGDVHAYRRVRRQYSDWCNLNGFPLDLRGSDAGRIPPATAAAEAIIARLGHGGRS